MTPETLWEIIERATGRRRPAVVTVTEFAQIMDISRVTAYRMAALNPDAGGLKTVQLLGTKRIPTSEIFRLFAMADAGYPELV